MPEAIGAMMEAMMATIAIQTNILFLVFIGSLFCYDLIRLGVYVYLSGIQVKFYFRRSEDVLSGKEFEVRSEVSQSFLQRILPYGTGHDRDGEGIEIEGGILLLRGRIERFESDILESSAFEVISGEKGGDICLRFGCIINAGAIDSDIHIPIGFLGSRYLIEGDRHESFKIPEVLIDKDILLQFAEPNVLLAAGSWITGRHLASG